MKKKISIMVICFTVISLCVCGCRQNTPQNTEGTITNSITDGKVEVTDLQETASTEAEPVQSLPTELEAPEEVSDESTSPTTEPNEVEALVPENPTEIPVESTAPATEPNETESNETVPPEESTETQPAETVPSTEPEEWIPEDDETERT